MKWYMNLLKSLRMFLMFILKHQTGGRSNVIEYDCKIIGSNRLMFGSDYPFGRAWF